jgi:hypothetical protein
MKDELWLKHMNQIWKLWTEANTDFMPTDFQGTILLYQAFLTGIQFGMKYNLDTTLTELAE